MTDRVSVLELPHPNYVVCVCITCVVCKGINETAATLNYMCKYYISTDNHANRLNHAAGRHTDKYAHHAPSLYTNGSLFSVYFLLPSNDFFLL